MDTSSISSNKITLRISTPQGKEMALNKGEVLQAQVQEVGDNGQVTIVVKGKTIEAFSEVAVKPGQQLLLMVDDLRHGKTYLKVVTPEMMGKIETANISANLLEMGVAAKEENIVLARKLLQHNLPVTQNNLNELNRNVSSLGGMNGRNLEIAAFALSRGITGKNALASLAQFLASPSDAAKLVPVLDRFMRALAGANPAGQADTAARNNAFVGNTSVSTAEPEASLSAGASRTSIPASQFKPVMNSLQNETANEMQSDQAGKIRNSSTISMENDTGTSNYGRPTTGTNSEAVNQPGASLNNAASATSAAGARGANPANEEQTSGSSQPTEALNSGKPEMTAEKAIQRNLTPGNAGLDEKNTFNIDSRLTGGAADEPEAMQNTGSSKDKQANAMLKEETIAAKSGGSTKVVLAQTAAAENEQTGMTTRSETATAAKNLTNEVLAKNNMAAKLADTGEQTAQQVQRGESTTQQAGTGEKSGQQLAAGGKTLLSPAGEKIVNIPSQPGNALIEEIPLPEEQSAALNKANVSGENTEKPVPVMQEPIITTGGKAVQEPSVVKTLLDAAGSGDDLMPASSKLLADDEIIDRLLGSDDRFVSKTGTQGSVSDSDTLKQNVVKLLDAVRSFMALDLEASPEKIASQLQGKGGTDKEIVKALNLLVDMANQPEMVEKIPELKEFSMSLDRLEKEISGQQLFNVSARNAADNMSGYYYFSFPVKIEQEYSLCQLRINKDGRKNLKEADKLSFVVSLNTSKLGMVLFHINWQKTGHLQLQGVAQNQASCNFLNRNIGALVGNLENLGYQVKNLGVKVSNTAEEFSIRPILQEAGERLRPLGIDVTV